MSGTEVALTSCRTSSTAEYGRSWPTTEDLSSCSYEVLGCLVEGVSRLADCVTISRVVRERFEENLLQPKTAISDQ